MRKFKVGDRVTPAVYHDKQGVVTQIDVGGYMQWYVYVLVLWNGVLTPVTVHTSNLELVVDSSGERIAYQMFSDGEQV